MYLMITAQKMVLSNEKRQQIRRKTSGNMCCLTFSGGFAVDVCFIVKAVMILGETVN